MFIKEKITNYWVINISSNSDMISIYSFKYVNYFY